jgi:6-pyruvoyltetrahydropterin 2'-reductase
MKLYLVEEFLSVQGEGKYLGELSIFFRFGGCNRTCEDLKVPYNNLKNEIVFGCDTYNAVDRDCFQNSWKEIENIDILIDIIKKYNCKNVVITGGEPLLNLNNNIFLEFIKFLNENKYKITIETNGDLDIGKEKINIFYNVVFSISPKDKIKEKDYWFLNKDSYLKVIFAHPKLDIEYICSLKEKGLNVYIMPNGEDVSTIETQRLKVLGFCIKYGLNYTTREHLYIFGSKSKIESGLVKRYYS